MTTYLVQLIRIRRVEFRIAEIPILAIPILLTLHDPSPVRTWSLWEGVFLFFLLFAFGDVVNCLADRDVDAAYKPHLSEAVYALGVRSVTVQAWALAGIALATAIHLGWQLHRWILVPLVGLGLLLGYAYSVPPLRLKSRGVLNFASVWAVVFLGPMLLAAFLVTDLPSALVIGTALAFGAIQEGIIQVNSAEDYVEDQESGVRTMIVALGLQRGITAAFVAVALGGAALSAIVAGAFAARGVPALGWLALVPLAAACTGAAVWVARLRTSIAGREIGESVAAVKRAGKLVPLWLTLAAWATLVCAVVFFLVGAGYW